MRCSRVLVLTVMAMASSIGTAQALDRIGPVYGIAEEDFAVAMKRKAYEALKDGRMDKARQKVLEKARKAFFDPKPIDGVTPAIERKTYYVDPGLVVAEDIRDHQGNLIAAAGTYVNALDHMKLDHGFLFFDSRDARQKGIAKQIVDHYGKRKVRIILVGGGPTPLENEWKMPVYYDQGGYLVNKLKLQSTPAFVTQDERRLRVDILPVQ